MGIKLQDSSCKKQDESGQYNTKTHRDLLVYNKAYIVSLEIYRASESFPIEEKHGVTNQLRRSSTSICANIAEGYGRQINSNTDFKRFLVIAKGSCQETIVWVDYCKDLSFINKETWEKWNNEYTEISKMLYSFIAKL